jgi:hypothetical protein
VFAPPLLLIVTPGATSVVEEVVSDDDGKVPAEDVASPLATDEVDDGGTDGDEPSAVPEASFVAPALVVPVSVAPVEESVPAAEPLVDVDEVLDGSALARPGEVMTKTPIPKAAANAPTRPTYRL